MEQSLGKRIMFCRKKQGLTQDKLAEMLGVTAQAVSKWENDLSCPDIGMLPKLAEIFGITTDELLGYKTEPVHDAQVVEEYPQEDGENEGLHIQKGNWEFKYDSGKRGAVFFAVMVLAVGILSVLSKVLSWDVSFWQILWPTALLVFGIQGLVSKFSFFSVGSTLFGGYFLLSNLGFLQLDLGDMVFPVIVVLFGLSLLADALRKPKKPRFTVTHKGEEPGERRMHKDYSIHGGRFDCSMCFGDNRQYVAMDRLEGGEIDCSFGDFVVDLSGCKEVGENCRIEADCSFGNLVILVPSRYQLVPESSTTFAHFDTEGTPDENPAGFIRMECDVSFGQITVRYI